VPFEEEVIVPFPVPRDRVPMGTEFKSTWLSGSLGVVKAHGHYERYLERLPKQYHEPILHSVAGTWLPAIVAVEHYRAIDSLGISTPERIEWGKEITRRLQKTIFSVGFHAARDAGVTPWSMLKVFPVQFMREWRGGGTAVFKLGPKDARVEVVGFPIAPIAHCRTGLRGVIGGMCELVCTKCYVSEIRELCTDTTLGYRVAWA
jgi:hypothetical protein